jgi:outer membrane protein
MFKKIILALAVALPLSAFAQKFGTVNIDDVFGAMPETAEMTKQIQEASQKYEAEFQKLQDEVNKLYTDYQTIQNDANTPDAIKERRLQEIQERASKADQFRQTASQDLQRQQQQLAAPIQQRVTDAIQAVGQEGGFTFIFPQEPGLLLYQGTDVIDVTAQVKTKLNIK